MPDRWKPADVVRLIAMLGAFILFCIGVLMMWKGIAVEGAIDIKSSVLSGTIKTASAGLFVAFLSFVVIIFVLTTMGGHVWPAESQVSKDQKTGLKGFVLAFWILLALSLLTGSLSALGYGQGFGAMSMGVGFGAFVLGFGLMSTDEIKPDKS